VAGAQVRGVAAEELDGLLAGPWLLGQHLHPGRADRRRDRPERRGLHCLHRLCCCLRLRVAQSHGPGTSGGWSVRQEPDNFRAIYAKATAAVRVREGQAELVSRAFDIRRGIVQGDICSPYGYTVALAGGGFVGGPVGAAGGAQRSRHR
jgi:hypothetical protein